MIVRKLTSQIATATRLLLRSAAAASGANLLPDSSSRCIRRQVTPIHGLIHDQQSISTMSDKKPKIQLDKEELRNKLTPEQFHVTQEQGTEAPWTGEYLRLKENGMYACVVCGSDLFSSDVKYESGCGWPSFYDVDESRLLFKEDLRHGRTRTEVTCSNCDAHLGHVFDDGPADKTGKRYCINSVSLTFRRTKPEEKADNEAQDK